MNADELLSQDRQHLWHPYASAYSQAPLFPVQSAQGARIRLADGRELIDGMASWWCAIHGYNHPLLNQAITEQLEQMAHVMFGGLTHEPAVQLGRLLTQITPAGLDKLFFADSGSVAVEVALKMAIQYQTAIGQPQRRHFVALRGAYHGDTLGAMSVCDPVTGMHQHFSQVLPQQWFAPRPASRFGQPCQKEDLEALTDILDQHHQQVAALILEPVVQGAGGMYFYSADYLRGARQLCDEYGVLLIADEIATGFGRSGRLFACEWAGISPDILCLGKALTGGYLTLAATLTRRAIAEAIDQGQPGLLMHGPTFMANPLACAVGLASTRLLLESDWQANIQRIQHRLQQGLAACSSLPSVAETRVLGAIGVVEMRQPVDMNRIQPALVEQGLWLRPFGKLVYAMPPYVISDEELDQLCQGIVRVLADA